MQDEIGSRVRWIDVDSAFNKRIRTSIVVNLAHIDFLSFLKDVSILFCEEIKEILKDLGLAMKINTVLSCKYKEHPSNCGDGKSDKDIETKQFNAPNGEVISSTVLKQWFNDYVLNTLLSEVEELQERDSGWTLDSIINIQININKFMPLRPGKYLYHLLQLKRKHVSM